MKHPMQSLPPLVSHETIPIGIPIFLTSWPESHMCRAVLRTLDSDHARQL
jgi:hypothetical protein